MRDSTWTVSKAIGDNRFPHNWIAPGEFSSKGTVCPHCNHPIQLDGEFTPAQTYAREALAIAAKCRIETQFARLTRRLKNPDMPKRARDFARAMKLERRIKRTK